MEKGDRTTHELLLRCVIIVTSVVPRQLPMQMAMAVNTALMALMKNGVFCTEPYRVPFAGKISHCLFDKTGTLTTDEQIPVCIINPGEDNDPLSETVMVPTGKAGGKTGPKVTGVPGARSVQYAAADTATVLAGCHSLLSASNNPAADNKKAQQLVGDPIEIAALKGIEWKYDVNTQTATPGNHAEKEKAVSDRRKQIESLKPGKEKDAALAKLAALEGVLREAEKRAKDSKVSAVSIKHRHHFSSHLQRMSVVASRSVKSGGVERCCLVKGSPEAVKLLLAPGTEPSWYDRTYRRMAEGGMRILALGIKVITEEEFSKKQPRDFVESNLTFAGFIAFTCRTRTDSPLVIQSLMQSDHAVAMVTGDAALTALHVAYEVGMCAKAKKALELVKQSEGEGVEWCSATGDELVTTPFDAKVFHGL
jgi:cation-transporting ATPase 13A1